MASPSLTDLADLRHILDYSPDTGSLLWKRRSVDMFSGTRPITTCSAWNGRYAGRPAMCNSHNGYLSSMVFGKRVMAHKAAWAIHYGEWPAGQIDHINGNRSDNRISNLRVVTPVENQWNAKARTRAIGYASKRGAHWHKANNKWSASIRVHLGYFDSEDEAAEAYERAARQFHGKYYLPNGARPDS